MMQFEQIYKDRIEQKVIKLQDDAIKHIEESIIQYAKRGEKDAREAFVVGFESWVIQKLAAVEVILDLMSEREQRKSFNK